MVPIDEPVPVRVVSSRSEHDVCNGPLLIHQNESFRDFCKAIIACRPVHVSLPPKGRELNGSVEQAGDSVLVECAGVRISVRLKRTLRLPDDDKVYDLPAELGTFPLFNAAQFQEALPYAMKPKGGVLLAMYQREAMFMEFNFWRRGPHCRRIALRALAGGVNTLSGEAQQRQGNPARDTQDYIVVPGQKWLDGFRVSDSEVRQFVAMPVGLGYSVEQQITGEELVGGIQFEILQERLPELALDSGSVAPRSWRSDGVVRPLASGWPPEVDGNDTPANLGLKIGDTFDLSKEVLDIVKFYYPEYRSNWKPQPGCRYSPLEAKRATSIRDFLPSLGVQNGELQLTATHDTIPLWLVYHAKAASGGQSQDSSATVRRSHVVFSPFILATDFFKFVLEGAGFSTRSADILIAHKGVRLYPEADAPLSHSFPGPRKIHTLFDLGIPPSSKIDVTCPPPIMPVSLPRPSTFEALCDRPPVRREPGALPRQRRGLSWEMAIATGSRIKQNIFVDPEQWHWEAQPAGMFNIQIINAAAFTALTGRAAPPTPISAATYAAKGIPFYSQYEETPLTTEAARALAGLRSVGAIDREREREGRLGLAPRVDPGAAAAGCTACEPLRGAAVLLAEQIVRPCNHAVCGLCWAAVNGGTPCVGMESKMESCPVCRGSAVGTVLYSAPMGMWEAERQLGCALQDVQLVMLTKKAEDLELG